MRSFFHKIAMLSALGIMLLGMIPAAARAATVSVSNLAELTNAIQTAAVTDEIQLTGTITLSNQNVTLDLKGHTLIAASGKPAFYLTGKDTRLTLTGTGTIRGGDYDFGILEVRNKSTLTLSGKITLEGNTSSNRGGAVTLLSGSSFYMEDGVISGTSAPYGGAVYIASDCFMSMTGGTITGTSATTGGALYVAGSMTMADGTITGTSATSGGAAYVAGSITMSAGSIEKTSATYGGAAYIASKGSFTLSPCPAEQLRERLQLPAVQLI